MPTSIPVYLEVGARRTFAGALDWPGWCRSGRDETAALAALVAYGGRYQRAIRSARLEDTFLVNEYPNPTLPPLDFLVKSVYSVSVL